MRTTRTTFADAPKTSPRSLAPAYVSVGWAFPSSRTARELGRSSTGCYFLELETATSERVSISGPYSSVPEAEREGDKTGLEWHPLWKRFAYEGSRFHPSGPALSRPSAPRGWEIAETSVEPPVQGRQSASGITYFIGHYKAADYRSWRVGWGQPVPAELAQLIADRGVDVRQLCG